MACGNASATIETYPLTYAIDIDNGTERYFARAGSRPTVDNPLA
jgi:hypothetical protein